MSEMTLEELARMLGGDSLADEVRRELAPDSVRRDCAFCGRERSRADDNHAPECFYWQLFGGSA